MKINDKYKLTVLADENVVFIPGTVDGEQSKLMVLNATSTWLWENLLGKDFETKDVVNLLLSEYDVDEATATADAMEWVSLLDSYNIFD
ncbi:MAG: PqqD family protein [Bacteroidales bacterium]|nr:PqqD family protein [Bacteroidales bacterium]